MLKQLPIAALRQLAMQPKQLVLLLQLLVQRQRQKVIIRLLWVMIVRQLEPVLLLQGMALRLVL
ncbi:hypothetical protein EIKCOROL_00449 [Eikenella corrodens ATCC 23834]|uniref:Uncharacterized protein n=1 Tax=Eikenella corrodens ATCC 23834 TaxID=546274 RepID=C0DSX6_EIKCO|nr:hypothetical protein EIKCOROL_00449 [Eikenella corrodens ATCC 23834]